MNRLKKFLFSVLTIALVLSTSSIPISASENHVTRESQYINAVDIFGLESSVDSRLTTASKFSNNYVDPNKVEELDYILIYDTDTGAQSTRMLEPDESINSVLPESSINNSSVGAVGYRLTLTPNEGNSEIDITFSITSFIGTKPNKIELDFLLFRGLERGTSGTSLAGCSSTIQGTLNVKVGKTVTCKAKITQTGFYFGKIDMTIRNLLGQSMGHDTSQTTQILTNKRAVAYPFYVDQWSGRVMTEPATVTWARTPSIPWDSKKDRGDYIALYSQLYPKNKWDWNGAVTHIHHIRPRNLGGTNDFNNLIPIPASFHTGIVSPWFVNY